MCNYHVVIRKHVFIVVTHCFWLSLILFLASSSLTILGNRHIIDISFGAVPSAVSLHVDQLWVSVLISVYCKKKLF